MDSFIPLFRGGKPREVMEIWFTGPHCLFSTHINYNQNQETLRLPFLMSSYTFRFFVCVCVCLSMRTVCVLWCSLLSDHHDCVSPGIFNTSLTPSCRKSAHTMHRQIYSYILYEPTHAHNKRHSVHCRAVLLCGVVS